MGQTIEIMLGKIILILYRVTVMSMNISTVSSLNIFYQNLFLCHFIVNQKYIRKYIIQSILYLANTRRKKMYTSLISILLLAIFHSSTVIVYGQGMDGGAPVGGRGAGIFKKLAKFDPELRMTTEKPNPHVPKKR